MKVRLLAAQFAVSDRWHVLMGEFWGWVSVKSLVRLAKHALAADDAITVYRVRDVISFGVQCGWDDRRPDRGKIVPGRTRELVQKLVEFTADDDPDDWFV